MRNIKQMLRFSRNSALLFAAATGLVYLTACSSDITYNGDQNVTESPAENGSYTVYGANPNRVHNFGNEGTRAISQTSVLTEMNFPAAPTETEIASAKTTLANEQWSLKGSYVVEGTLNISQAIQTESDDAKIFIKNGAVLETPCIYNNLPDSYSLKIYVLDGGKLKLSKMIGPNIKVYCFGNGKFEYPSEFSLQSGTEYLAEDSINATGLTLDGNNVVASKSGIHTKGKLEVQGTSKFLSLGDITAEYIEVESGATVMTSESLSLGYSDNTGIMGKVVACQIDCPGILTCNDGFDIQTSYLKAPKLLLSGKGKITLDKNGVIEAIDDSNTGQVWLHSTEAQILVEQGENNRAVIKTNEFKADGDNMPKNQIGTGVYLVADKLTLPNAKTLNDLELWYSDTENTVIYLEPTGCSPGYGKKPDTNDSGSEEGSTDETVTVPEIVKVTEIDPLDEEINHGNHDHGVISATCIQFGADGTAYASYHLRGDGQKGCIEVIKDNGSNGLTLSSYMISPDYDFNHILVDDDRIITVGNHKKKAAFVGMLPTSFEASQGVRSDFLVNELTTDEVIYDDTETNKDGEKVKLGYKNAGDGNCIVKYGTDNYLFTSYRGYGAIKYGDKDVFDSNTGKKTGTTKAFMKVPGTFHATTGSSKHIALSGDKAVVLSHDTYDKTSSTASVESWSLSNGTYAKVLAKYDAIGTIAPVDGKNVVAIDGEDIYACLSHGGLARIRRGQVETKTFGKGETDAKYAGVPVNGMAIDSDYIYLAAGSFVIVLDKTTMNEVCHYYAKSTKSANYIALNNGKIYVAYGEDGIMAFQLRHKTIEL